MTDEENEHGLSEEELDEAIEDFKEKTGFDDLIIIGFGFGKRFQKFEFDVDNFEKRAKAIGYMTEAVTHLSGENLLNQFIRKIQESDGEEVNDEQEE